MDLSDFPLDVRAPLKQLLSWSYIEKDGVPVHATTWAEYEEYANDFEKRRVALTYLTDDVHVSTVFLMIDHAYRSGVTPVLYETMVFGGAMDTETDRYHTREEALAGHEAMVERVRKSLDNADQTN